MQRLTKRIAQKHYSSANTSEKAQNLQVLHKHRSHHQARRGKNRIKEAEQDRAEAGMDVNAIKDNNFQSLSTEELKSCVIDIFSKDQVTAPTDYEVQNANSSLENGFI